MANTHVSSEHVFDALRLIARADHSITTLELASALDIPVTSARRALATLENVDAVSKSYKSNGYQSGVLIQELLQSLFSYHPLRQLSMPFLKRLAQASGETASLGINIGWYGVRIAAAEGWKPVRASGVGNVVEIHKTLAGRVRLAFLTDAEVRTYLKSGINDRSVSPTHLGKELAAIRRRGYGIGIGFGSEVRIVAFPVRYASKLLGSISVEGPVFQFDPAEGSQQVKDWQSVVTELEEKLTHLPSSELNNPFETLDPQTFRLNLSPETGKP
jgi:DNA-binding IclR family transcriptional regulator